MSLFLCLFGISLGQIVAKVLPKVGFWEKYRKGDGHIRGVVYRSRVQTFFTL